MSSNLPQVFQFGELPPHDGAVRITSLRGRMAEEKVESLFVTNLTNLRYLAGFTGSSGYLLMTQDGAWFITDGRYDEQCRSELAGSGLEAEVCISGPDGLRPALMDVVTSIGLRSVGLEAADITWKLADDISDWLEGVEVVSTENLVESIRIRKAPSEIARMRAAAELGDSAFTYILERVEANRTEADIAKELERYMLDAGADSVSFDAIVATGDHAALPHASPSERSLRKGEMILFDFGCVVDGYCSDMSRTIALGSVHEDLVRAYEVVKEAQARGVASAREGVECSAVDAVCREFISESGHGDDFKHSTGHGVGLDIHEEPRLAVSATGILASGQVVTVEPGVYLTGIGGVRIEDMIAITDGIPEVLTTSSRELIVL